MGVAEGLAAVTGSDAGVVESTLKAAGVPQPVQNLAVTSLPHLTHFTFVVAAVVATGVVGAGFGDGTGAGVATGVGVEIDFFSSTTVGFGVTGSGLIAVDFGGGVTFEGSTGEGFGDGGASVDTRTGNLFPFKVN